MFSVELDRSQRILLGTMLGLSAVLLLLSMWAAPGYARGLALVAAFLFVYAAAALLSRLSDEWGGARGRTWIRKNVGDLGAGFYGVMGLAVFLLLEAQTLLDQLGGPTPIRSFVSELGINWLIGFSIESFTNFIQALIWPANLISDMGTYGAAIVAGICWAILWYASRVLPAECLECGDDEDEETDATNAQAAGRPEL